MIEKKSRTRRENKKSKTTGRRKKRLVSRKMRRKIRQECKSRGGRGINNTNYTIYTFRHRHQSCTSVVCHLCEINCERSGNSPKEYNKKGAGEQNQIY